MPPFDPGPLLVTSSDPDYIIEVMSDDRAYAIVVARFHHFDPAAARFALLTKNKPPMRVTLRRFAQLYGNYIPPRLHNSYDRSAEYPI